MSGNGTTGGIVSEHHGPENSEATQKALKLDKRRTRHREVYLKLSKFFYPKGLGFSFSFNGEVHTLRVASHVAEALGWTASRFEFIDPEVALEHIKVQA